jgi:hypothetical protein
MMKAVSRHLKQLMLIPVVLIFFSLCFVVKTQAATISLVQGAEDFKTSCKGEVDIFIDATNESSNGADIELRYNPSQIQIIDSISDASGIQILQADAYDTIFFNDVNESTGTIRIAAGSFVKKLSSSQKFATIEFVPKDGVTSSNITIRFDGVGQTFDSNVADSSTSYDILKSVTNLTFNVSKGECSGDTAVPEIIFTNPGQNQSYTNVSEPITFEVTDTSGVDLDSLKISINGKLYTKESSELEATKIENGYRFSLQISEDLLLESPDFMVVEINDSAGNKLYKQIAFNLPVNGVECPVVEDEVCQEPPPEKSFGDYLQNWFEENRGLGLLLVMCWILPVLILLFMVFASLLNRFRIRSSNESSNK